MGVNSPALLVRQGIEGGVKLLHRQLALIDLTRRERTEKGLVLNAVPGVQRVKGFVIGHAPQIVLLPPLILGQRCRHLVRDFNEKAAIAKRIIIPQIDSCHLYPPFRFLRMGQIEMEERRGSTIGRSRRGETSGQVGPKPGRRKHKRPAGINPVGRRYFVLLEIVFHLEDRNFPMQGQSLF